MHLIHHAIFYALERGAQFVLLGDAVHENGISRHFRHLKHHLNENPDCHLELGYSEELAHLVYAGADLLVVPSMFEPCGLAPMVGLRYGTVPVVRSVGGMVDTVFDRDFSPRARRERNGFAFEHVDHPAIESALGRAIRLWFDHPVEFRRLIDSGMRTDNSWNQPGRQYLNVYEHIRRDRGDMRARQHAANVSPRAPSTRVRSSPHQAGTRPPMPGSGRSATLS